MLWPVPKIELVGLPSPENTFTIFAAAESFFPNGLFIVVEKILLVLTLMSPVPVFFVNSPTPWFKNWPFGGKLNIFAFFSSPSVCPLEASIF